MWGPWSQSAVVGPNQDLGCFTNLLSSLNAIIRKPFFFLGFTLFSPWPASNVFLVYHSTSAIQLLTYLSLRVPVSTWLRLRRPVLYYIFFKYSTAEDGFSGYNPKWQIEVIHRRLCRLPRPLIHLRWNCVLRLVSFTFGLLYHFLLNSIHPQPLPLILCFIHWHVN